MSSSKSSTDKENQQPRPNPSSRQQTLRAGSQAKSIPAGSQAKNIAAGKILIYQLLFVVHLRCLHAVCRTLGSVKAKVTTSKPLTSKPLAESRYVPGMSR